MGVAHVWAEEMSCNNGSLLTKLLSINHLSSITILFFVLTVNRFYRTVKTILKVYS